MFDGTFDKSRGNRSGPTAEDTADGTVAVSAARAAELLKDPAKTCQGWAVEAEAQPSLIQFVVDISGSMKEASTSTAGESKWAVTRRALAGAIDQLPPNYAVGLSFFPNMIVDPNMQERPSSACVNPANDVALDAMSPDQRQLLLDALDSVVIEPMGATPTYDAYAMALERVRSTTLVGSRYIVLITDGQPTQGKGCVGSGSVSDPQSPDDILAAIGQAKTDAQIQTFVVGAPGSEKNYSTDADARIWLSNAARLGGTAQSGCSDNGPNFCHFDVTQATDFSSALAKALTTITRSAMACTFDVPMPSDAQKLDPAKVNMIYNDSSGGYFLVLPNGAESCSKGWDYLDDTQRVVQICGATCSLIQANPMARLSILFGCYEDQIDQIW